ncbi:class I SAM-dependent methyltransferase [Kaarinaea lacus]
MINWKTISEDPNNFEAQNRVHEFLHRIRRLESYSHMDWLITKVTGKTCLDIGAVEHDLSYTERPHWKHKQISLHASKVVGIDILEEHVEQLRHRGFDIRLCDATSDTYLGDKFETVIIGDVIEHVENPANLLRFALRHLAPNGEIIVTTPNPYYTYHIKKFAKDKPFVNLDHIYWYTPTMALDLARRTNCELKSYIVSTNERPWYAQFFNPELFSRNYIFIFGT